MPKIIPSNIYTPARSLIPQSVAGPFPLFICVEGKIENAFKTTLILSRAVCSQPVLDGMAVVFRLLSQIFENLTTFKNEHNISVYACDIIVTKNG